MKLRLTIILTIVAALGVSAQPKHVDAVTFYNAIKAVPGIVLDVRTAGEYSRGHIEGSTLISTSDRQFVKKVSLLQRTKPIYVYCLTGSRSRAVANYLSKNGYTHIVNLSRGIISWNRQGYPSVKSTKTIASTSKSFTQATLNKVLTENNMVLVDFHAPWCAPCKQLTPTLDKISKAYAGKMLVEKVDVDVNAGLQQMYGVASIPGLILYKNGKEVWRHIGVISYDELRNTIDRF